MSLWVPRPAVLAHANWNLEGQQVSEKSTGAVGPVEPHPTSTNAVPQLHGGSATTGPLVLIAEDEAPIAEAVAWVVEDAGYTPLLARNGQEALELIRTRRPALLITDWMMPHLDGVGLLRALKQQAAQDGLASIPTILMTAAFIGLPKTTEADAVLPKPFEVEDLQALLRHFLGPQET